MKPSQKRYTHNNRGSRHGGKPQGRYHHTQGRSSAAQRNHLQQQLEKYTNLAREVSSTGDKILAESHYQYAEHYLRMLNIIKEDDARIAAQEQAERDARDAIEAEKVAAVCASEDMPDTAKEESAFPEAVEVMQPMTPSDVDDAQKDASVTPIRRRRKKATQSQDSESKDSSDAHPHEDQAAS